MIICVIGTGFRNRVDIIDTIYKNVSKYDIKIIGILWGKLKSYNLIKDKIKLIAISDEEASKYYSNVKINLNIHRAYNDDTIKKLNIDKIKAISPNNRTFDISAVGGFQIVDYREDLDRFYKIGEEIVAYDDVKDLINKIHYYLEHDEERIKLLKMHIKEQ
ncbi:glycosyltransferase family 1 protein [Aceticella autotrophica]|uniref:Glycosyltransferase family 1 protein n=1 Tax=Aceticella autotrophica TaxID=2755338 RepID=A0A975GBA5_9THEO|nr:glycosyltransferase [Aceticella autotrophica]QSZ27971.1 glycosyltransferase family 1 protein [Aceticella autotrophica]